jgi:hypothetical protein
MTNQEPLADTTTNLVSKAETSSQQLLRRVFYNDVLTAVPVDPRKDLEKLCKAWLEVTGAEWVWLWLQHGDGENRPWELTAVYGIHGDPKDYIPTAEEYVSIDNKESVAEYVSKLKRPIFVEDIKTWQREDIDGQTHNVVAQKELDARNCHAFLSVPLLFPKLETPTGPSLYTHIGNIRGLVCSHFTKGKPIKELQHEESYRLMGYATAAAIGATFAAERHRILYGLDALATKYLNKGGRIDENRKDYLTEIIELIKDHLQVDYVSVFYQTPLDQEMIECIASTGLYDGNGGLLGKNPPGVRYKKMEGMTGKVFATGNPFISKIGQNPERPGGETRCKTREWPDETTNHAWICYPMTTSEPNPNNSDCRQTLGVLRCIGNKSMLAQKHDRNFDPIQIQTLDFIARQLAPVLETMAIHIAREREITIIKHDLYNPIRMIDAGVEAVTDRVEESKLPSHWEPNMKFSLAMAKNLVGCLSEKQAFLREPTLLEGEIVAPLMRGLRYFAQLENHTTIRFENIREVFPKLDIDHDLIERVFFNLVLNATKYSDYGSEITVLGEKTGVDYRLHVSNFGIGVEESDKERIFNGEYRSPKAKRLKHGLGLGLKIARAAMRRHDGDLLLTNLANPTTFTMVFPKKLASDSRNH